MIEIIGLENKHPSFCVKIPLTDLEINMLISSYETKIGKIVRPLQRFETGLELTRYKDDNGLKKCFEVKFKNRMDDHNYRVSIGTPDCLTDIVYTRKFVKPHVYREWYLTEIRHKYTSTYGRLTHLAKNVGYDYSHLIGQLNFTKEEEKSMDHFREVNANKYVGEDGWEGF